MQLIKNHLQFSKGNNVSPSLCLNGIDILDRKCNNKHIHKLFQMKRKITPRGKFYWGSLVTDINYQINSVYLTKSRKFIIKSFIGFILLTLISKYSDIDETCSFCGSVEETIAHLFCDCNITKHFWTELSSFIFSPKNMTHNFLHKEIIFYYENPKLVSLEYIVNFCILYAKFFIHKQRWLKSPLSSPLFLVEFNSIISSLKLINNKKSDILMHYEKLFKDMS